jgi:hypothetical protein
MLWGRLSYDPSLPDTLFQRTLAARYPEARDGELFAAYKAASKVIPQINRFFWAGGGNYLAWFPEACLSHPKHHGFYTAKVFINGGTTPGSGMMSIREYTDAISHKAPSTGITPPEVADQLRADATQALKLLDANHWRCAVRPGNSSAIFVIDRTLQIHWGWCVLGRLSVWPLVRWGGDTGRTRLCSRICGEGSQ